MYILQGRDASKVCWPHYSLRFVQGVYLARQGFEQSVLASLFSEVCQQQLRMLLKTR